MAFARLFRRAASSLALPAHKCVPMPRLSPSMTSGTVLKWQVDEGEPLPDAGMEVLFSVRPDNLRDEVEDSLSDDPDEAPILDIESHEEGYLAVILVREGECAKPDEACAVVADRKEDVGILRAAYSDATARPMVEPGTFAWQAYLQGAAQECSNS